MVGKKFNYIQITRIYSNNLNKQIILHVIIYS